MRKYRVPSHHLTLTDLLGPDLPGAHCRGKAPNFDTDIPGETTRQRNQRHATARETCHHCPAQTACHNAINTMTGKRSGIWAGTTYGQS